MDSKSEPSTAPTPAEGEERRGFFVQFSAVIIGGFVGLVPLASGLTVLLDPLRRKKKSEFVKVATLDSVPDDGMPRQFSVLADHVDAWNYYPNEPIGLVYLRRKKGANEVEALNAACPHAGCFVGFKSDSKQFDCPCHDSSFTPEGERINPESCPSPRGLDTLSVDPEKLKEGEVWVDFKNFLTGTPGKVEE